MTPKPKHEDSYLARVCRKNLDCQATAKATCRCRLQRRSWGAGRGNRPQADPGSARSCSGAACGDRIAPRRPVPTKTLTARLPQRTSCVSMDTCVDLVGDRSDSFKRECVAVAARRSTLRLPVAVTIIGPHSHAHRGWRRAGPLPCHFRRVGIIWSPFVGLFCISLTSGHHHGIFS